ncbi:ABC transporter substrate-binding protein [Alsobacter sp. SYSU BS001988]
MRRRKVLAILGAIPVLLGQAKAQPPRIRKIGFLWTSPKDSSEVPRRLALFEDKLRKLGWRKGENLDLIYRWNTGNPDFRDQNIRDVLEAGCEVVGGGSTPVTTAFLKQTQTVPFVFIGVTDPVANGFVQSIRRPGGNATGFIDLDYSVSGKAPQLLKELSPDLSSLYALYNPSTQPVAQEYLSHMERAANSMQVHLVPAPVRNVEEMTQVIEDAGQDRRFGACVLSDVFMRLNRYTLIKDANRLKVPVVYPASYYVKDGGLVSYGIAIDDFWPRTAEVMHRILHGERPSEIPIELPSKFELGINIKTAEAMGMAIPPSVLARADDIVE